MNADADPDLPRDEIERLRRLNAELEGRLREAEDTLAAIRGGDVDALIVGEDIYTLDSANAASNAMRKDVLAQMQDAVLAFDAEGHLIFMNPAAEAQYGRSASQMLGRPRDELYRERWADEGSARRSRQALREHGTYRAESVHLRGDGRELHVEATVARLNDAHGQALGTLCVIRDIGERIEAQARLAEAAEELARRERRFSTLVENSPDIFARLDRQLRHIYVSPVIERYTGTPAASFIGKTNAELGMPPELVASWGRAFEGVFERGVVDRVQFRFVAANGKPVDFESRLIPEFAEDGTIESVLSIASDVTEQARVGAALLESKARLEFTLAAARVGEWEIDVDSGACRHSALFDRCFGLDAPRVPWNLDVLLSLVHADDREPVRALIAHRFRTREVLDFEARVIWPDGGVHWIHAQGSAYVEGEAAGGRLRYLGIISDITDRKHAEAALRDADTRKDEFLATLAHELRNPLAPIRNAVQIMQLSRSEDVHENARNIIERQLKQMVHLVDDLLDVSRISQGKVELRREIVDVAGVVTAAVETSRPLIDAGRHELAIRLGAQGALRVDADVTRLCQILANLLNNAAKYTPEGGRIEITAERDGAHASICVRDSGIGISKEMLPRVFDMFAQVDRSMERAQGGLGIGLALVKRLVEMHGGTVTASSGGPDLGCRFVVRLPLVDEAPGRPGPAPAPADARGLGSGVAAGQRVLVVDDNVDSAESLSQMLAMLGYETATAHDGIEAVEAVRTRGPAIVLLDIGMPRMNGLDAARAIRRLPGGDRIILIALSGWGQHEDRRRSNAAGFDHHFVKPLDVEALIDLLGKATAR
ncbi:MAG: PAS domain S-box protein [Burkholderiaceae bacterium]